MEREHASPLKLSVIICSKNQCAFYSLDGALLGNQISPPLILFVDLPHRVFERLILSDTAKIIGRFPISFAVKPHRLAEAIQLML